MRVRFAVATAVLPAPFAQAQSLSVSGLSGRFSLTPDALKAMHHETLTVTNGHSHARETYSGVRFVILAFLLALPCLRVFAQERVAPALRPYISCTFGDGLQVVSLDPLPTTPMVRTVDTPGGPKQITMLEGERIMLAYPAEDFFANVKAEQLDPKEYPREKADLIAQLGSFISDGKSRIEPNLPTLHGFETHGLNRLALEGGVLGIYLFFDDKQAVVTTMYLLNGEPGQRRFQTLPEYAKLRDHFLETYAGCVRANQGESKR